MAGHASPFWNGRTADCPSPDGPLPKSCHRSRYHRKYFRRSAGCRSGRGSHVCGGAGGEPRCCGCANAETRDVVDRYLGCDRRGAGCGVGDQCGAGIEPFGLCARDACAALQVGAALLAGDISYAMFQTIVYRTNLITDTDALAAVDAELAAKVRRWASLTRGRLAAYVDIVVERADSHAVRRRREAHANREFSIWDGGQGLTEVFGSLHTTDALAVDARFDALAATVCDDDPRTRKQRRADAMGALGAGAVRLDRQCRQPHCPAGQSPLPRPVVIHVIASRPACRAPGTQPVCCCTATSSWSIWTLPSAALQIPAEERDRWASVRGHSYSATSRADSRGRPVGAAATSPTASVWVADRPIWRSLRRSTRSATQRRPIHRCRGGQAE